MIDLEPFCLKFDHPAKKIFEHPFKHGEYVAATDGHIIVVVTDVDPDFDASDLTDHTKKNYVQVVPSIPGNAKSVATPDTPDKAKSYTCTACGGVGAWDECDCVDGCDKCDDDHCVPAKDGPYECHTCDGTGIETPIREINLYDDVWVDEAKVIRLKALPGLRFYPAKAPDKPIPFKFDQGYGALMGVRGPARARSGGSVDRSCATCGHADGDKKCVQKGQIEVPFCGSTHLYDLWTPTSVKGASK